MQRSEKKRTSPLESRTFQSCKQNAKRKGNRMSNPKYKYAPCPPEDFEDDEEEEEIDEEDEDYNEYGGPDEDDRGDEAAEFGAA